MGDYRALKWIPPFHPDLLEKEYQSLLHYRNAAARLRSPHLVSIEHVNRNEAGLYYVMPLADGLAEGDPVNLAWQPLTLATLVDARFSAPAWFSSGEITAILVPILHGLQTLCDAGLVHRDVKPENILFSMAGRAWATSVCLARTRNRSPGAVLPVMRLHRGMREARSDVFSPGCQIDGKARHEPMDAEIEFETGDFGTLHDVIQTFDTNVHEADPSEEAARNLD
jgi:serine/threonine protein kinase